MNNKILDQSDFKLIYEDQDNNEINMGLIKIKGLEKYNQIWNYQLLIMIPVAQKKHVKLARSLFFGKEMRPELSWLWKINGRSLMIAFVCFFLLSLAYA